MIRSFILFVLNANLSQTKNNRSEPGWPVGELERTGKLQRAFPGEERLITCPCSESSSSAQALEPKAVTAHYHPKMSLIYHGVQERINWGCKAPSLNWNPVHFDVIGIKYAEEEPLRVWPKAGGCWLEPFSSWEQILHWMLILKAAKATHESNEGPILLFSSFP